MDPVRYDIELRGRHDANGTLGAVALRDLLDVMIQATARTLRLAVEGVSTRRGSRPEWLTESVDFTVTGIHEGSTVFPVEIARLDALATSVIAQQDLWRPRPRAKATAFTLLAEVLQDIEAGDRSSTRYDKGVLQSLRHFDRLITNGETITIRGISDGAETCTISYDHIRRAKELEQETPDPFSVVLSGKLNTIAHTERDFLLQTSGGDNVRGTASNDAITTDYLKDLWGKPVTLQGTAHFTPGGTLRFIETRALRPYSPKDDVFIQSVEEVEEEATRKPLAEQDLSQYDISGTLNEIRGEWPGDESIDDILDHLD